MEIKNKSVKYINIIFLYYLIFIIILEIYY